MEEMNQAINAATSPAVQMWMNWMLLVFMLSIVFVWKFPPARWVLGAFILSGIVGFLIFKITQKPHLIGISHIVLWIPLGLYLYKSVIKSSNFKRRSIYGVWILLVMATIVISVVFDFRDVAMVFLGMKN